MYALRAASDDLACTDAVMRLCPVKHDGRRQPPHGSMLVPWGCSTTANLSLFSPTSLLRYQSNSCCSSRQLPLWPVHAELIRHALVSTVRPVSSPPTVSVTRTIYTRRRSQLHQVFCQF